MNSRRAHILPFDSVLEVPRYSQRTEIAITVDYELWDFIGTHPTSVEREMLAPAAALMNVCELYGARLTLMFEFAGYLLLCRDAPHLARRIEAQLTDAVRRGHDVQLHLHAHLLPELGSRYDNLRGTLTFARYRTVHEALSLNGELFLNARRHCEAILKSVRPEYAMTVFRAGKYQIQPHAAVYDALAKAGFEAASNVVCGQRLARCQDFAGYDYRHAWTETQPYFPAGDDICWPTDKHDGPILELPICSLGGVQWSFDALDGPRLQAIYEHFRPHRTPLVMMGHSKGNVEPKLEALEHCLSAIVADGDAEFITLSELAGRWRSRYREGHPTAWQQCWQQLRGAIAEPVEQTNNPHHTGRIAATADDRLVERILLHYQELRATKRDCRVLLLNPGLGHSLLSPLARGAKDIAPMSVSVWDEDRHVAQLLRQAYQTSGLNLTVHGAARPRELYDVILVASVPTSQGGMSNDWQAAAEMLAPGGVMVVCTTRVGLRRRAAQWFRGASVRRLMRSKRAAAIVSSLIRLKRRRSNLNLAPRFSHDFVTIARRQVLHELASSNTSWHTVLQESECTSQIEPAHPGQVPYPWLRWFDDRDELITVWRGEDKQLSFDTRNDETESPSVWSKAA